MDEILQLTKIDWTTLFVCVFVALIGVKAIVSLFEWFINKLGLETKWTKVKKQDHELLIKTAKNLSALQELHMKDVAKSDKNDNLIKEDIKNISNKIDVLSKQITTMQTNIDETEMAKLKDTIVTYYKKYKDIGEWSTLEKDAFWDLFKRYEAHGGDGYVHEIIEPVMREINVID